MNRRGFLSGILALSAAPAIVSAGTLMRIQPAKIILWGDGVHDDTAGLEALHLDREVYRPDGSILRASADRIYLPAGKYKLSCPLVAPPPKRGQRETDRRYTGRLNFTYSGLQQ